eukprot:TRINITY_DN11699_c0_g1_i2.p1 TRINITY_DN11699_c0_g1~~TRINITY_DN11699_c0_g1_i2.p1  ORF type:complete len:625 (-),score=107.55 TRINITY_DN11699_c0_g1_i2:14-1723(-)
MEETYLSRKYTCISWSLANLQKNKKRKRNALENRSGYIAAGSKNGTIVLWDVTQNKVYKTLGGTQDAARLGHRTTVTDVQFSNDGNSIVSAGADQKIAQWNTKTGQILRELKTKQIIRHLSFGLSDTSLITAASRVEIFDLSSEKRLYKFTGSSSIVTHLATSTDQKVIATSTGDRLISLWSPESQDDAHTNKGYRKLVSKMQVHTLRAADALTCIAISTKRKKGAYHILGVMSESCSVAVWKYNPSDPKQKKPSVPHCVIQLTPVTSDVRIFSSQFCDARTIVIAYGSEVRVHFARIAYVEDNGGIKKEVTVTIEAEQLGSLLSKPTKKVNATLTEEPAMLHAVNPSAPVMSDVKMNVDRKGTTPSTGAETFEDKVRALQEKSATEDVMVIPRAGSVTAVLEQALHTSDSKLIQTVLDKVSMAEKTVETLRPRFVLPLLELLITRFRQNTNKQYLVLWIRAVFLHHAAALRNNPKAANHLGELHATIEEKVSSFSKMLALRGRLDLVLAQAQLVSEANRGTKADHSRFIAFEDSDFSSSSEDEKEMEQDENDSVDDESSSGSEEEKAS